ncbi:hypothetical protein ACFLSJ_00050 [Verrucomicrobiota bacterium]
MLYYYRPLTYKHLAFRLLPIGWRLHNCNCGTGRTVDFPAGDTGEGWIDATVPGGIHMDCLREGMIPDPFCGTNIDHCICDGGEGLNENDWLSHGYGVPRYRLNRLSKELLPSVVHECSPDIPYVPSSPFSSRLEDLTRKTRQFQAKATCLFPTT